MSSAEAFFAFFTLLLGLGLASLLSRFADLLRHLRLRDIGAVPLLLAVLIVFEFLSGWAGAARSFGSVEINIASLSLPFLIGGCYFLASVLVFPEPQELGDRDVHDYVASQLPKIAFFLFAANIFLIIAEMPAIWERAAREPGYWAFYVPYNGAILASYVVMMAVRARRVTTAAMIALLLIYLTVTLSRAI